MFSRAVQNFARRTVAHPLRQPVRNLNIHEYQSQNLMRDYGVNAPRGIPATTPEAALEAAKTLGGGKVVVKSQVLAGGRGKGTFVDGFQGGVHLASGPEEAKELASKMLGNHLVTKQTTKDGLPVNTVLVAEAVPGIKREYYFSIMIDRSVGGPIMIASAEGGMNIEEVAEANPDAIIKMPLHPDGRREPEKCAEVARKLGFTEEQIPAVGDLFDRLYHMFETCDCTMIEVNPLAELDDGSVMVFDAKVGFDDSAEPRQPEIFAMRDKTQEDPRDVEAEEAGINYVGLDGNIGSLVNGAGLAMSTMDCVAIHGGTPANFLDFGGASGKKEIRAAFEIILNDTRVKSVFVNVFAGIARADLVAEGLVAAAQEVGLKVPVVARLRGNGADRAAEIIGSSGLPIHSEQDFDKAAALASKLANE